MRSRLFNRLTGGRRRRRLAVAGLVLVALALLAVAVETSRPTRTQAAPAKSAVEAPVRRADAPTRRAVAASKPAASQKKPPPKASLSAAPTTRKQMPDPVRISIPAIGVDARVIRLGLNPDRTIEVPTNLADTGWFEPGPEPGEQGSAVIVGHLESLAGPGVFDRLRELRVGQTITIRLRDGTTVRYVADSMIRVSKNEFPTDRVYAQTKEPTLRLITCAGTMNATGYHPDNYIVFGSLAR
jgi:LPXTG-site transpeptidase (sortase) family protein